MFLKSMIFLVQLYQNIPLVSLLENTPFLANLAIKTNMSLIFSDQLWKLDKNNFTNGKKKKWMSTDQWSLKAHGEMVYIQNMSTNKVLTTDGNTVTEETLEENNSRQMWKKSKMNKDSYFFLSTNCEFPKFLTAKSTSGFKLEKGTV